MSETDKDFPLRRPMMFGLIALLILVAGFGTWAATTEISGAIIAGGRIQVDQNRQVVQHADGGTVSEILVDEGDVVEKGDVLIRLDPTLLQSELTIVEGQYFELLARRARLEAERDNKDEIVFPEELLQMASADGEISELVDGQRNLFFARLESVAREVEQLGKRSEQIGNQVVGIEAQTEALGSQLALIEKELTDQQTLFDRGLAQASRVLALQREEARLSGERGELIAQKAQAEGQITEIDIEILKLATARREEAITTLRDMQFRSRELAEQRQALREQLKRMEITAPVSGVVYGLTVFTPRSVIRAAEPVLYLIPQDRPLVISVQVEPIHIDQTHIGQQVSLRFAALDQRTTPELFGTVTKISADAFTDENTSISYYRAEIVLSEGEMAKLPEDTTLIPGMPVEAFLRTADRTPLAYLVKPFTDYFSKAFRES
ncbi:HlyD family type I secretion periplasmic adaptor subunit [Salipiger sp. P9]|uniref:HlyD family type I secretion periplasmic adaptor subunit n=1 Tax=Salipiger pentaromativorans TaxID=2943193 RepID=UPI00215826B3|nr:HlyD family type I secretion periplasmic adaptor subunit [Salipiger pentaromativorans]MCR8548360.1 HlyD family type I secretion periplasmic adaptor subunit [Salipiger pentaromativorans]